MSPSSPWRCRCSTPCWTASGPSTPRQRPSRPSCRKCGSASRRCSGESGADPPIFAAPCRSSGPTSGFTLTSSLTQELQDVLTTSAELAHSRASKVMGVRTDQHALLPLEQFIGMFNAAWSFVVDCEVLCRKMIVGLRGTMVVQVRPPPASPASSTRPLNPPHSPTRRPRRSCRRTTRSGSPLQLGSSRTRSGRRRSRRPPSSTRSTSSSRLPCRTRQSSSCRRTARRRPPPAATARRWRRRAARRCTSRAARSLSSRQRRRRSSCSSTTSASSSTSTSSRRTSWPRSSSTSRCVPPFLSELP